MFGKIFLISFLSVALSESNFCKNFESFCTNDCTAVIQCKYDLHLNLVPSIRTNCTQLGLECNPVTNDCTQSLGSCLHCNESILFCPSNGNQPNPCDCQEYYTCSGTAPIIRQRCDPGFIFDPSTNRCSLKWDPAICSVVLPPRCVREGHTGVYPFSDYRYYICTKSPFGDLVHELYECPMGQRWDPVLLTCVDPLSPPPVPGNPGFTCPSAGRFADKENCRAYFECNNLLQYEHKWCLPLKYYNENRKKCILGFC